MSVCNLITSLPRKEVEEITENLVVGHGTRVERIVSHGQATPDGFWYDQSEDEFVIVLSGRAKLAIEGEQQDLFLGPGDAVYLPAHRRHRVAWTDSAGPTVWLAVFLDPELSPAPAGPLAAASSQQSKVPTDVILKGLLPGSTASAPPTCLPGQRRPGDKTGP